MTIYVKDAETSKAVRELARLRGVTLTEAIRDAVANEYRKLKTKPPLRERIKYIQDRIAARPLTGLQADKAFFDDLSGN